MAPGPTRRDIHLDPKRSKFKDTFCNDTYGTVNDPPKTEHELAVLARDALKDAGMKATPAGARGAAAGVADAGERKLLQAAASCVGCLSFPLTLLRESF